MSKEIKIMVGIALVVIIAGGILLFKNNNTPPTVADAGKLVRDDSHITGDKSAKVTLVEFGDYECPYCAQSYPMVRQITDNYKSNPNFNFVFRNFPLPQHKYAQEAAEAAEGAGSAGKYWQMNDWLYTNQNTWLAAPNPLDNFVTEAQTLGLNPDQFRSDVQSKKYQNIINEDLADGTALKVNATPTFFLNGQQFNLTNYNDAKSTIDALLVK